MRITGTKSVILSPERLSILLALADGPAPGANIGDRIIGDSVGSSSPYKKFSLPPAP